ncbi:MAG: hypothetical protein M3220_18855 [Chloroflexota bacterium]|nr:hypothetical protein [Chloroflexota bacterium]
MEPVAALPDLGPKPVEPSTDGIDIDRELPIVLERRIALYYVAEQPEMARMIRCDAETKGYLLEEQNITAHIKLLQRSQQE